MLTPISLKNYFSEHSHTTLKALQQTFPDDHELLDLLLEQFQKRGYLCQRKLTRQCGKSCHQCPSNQVTIYEWIKYNV